MASNSLWSTLTIDQFADVRSGKRLPKGHVLIDGPTAYPYVRLVDIENQRIRRKDMRFLDEDTYHSISRYIVNAHDVVLAIVGHTIGLVCYVDPKWDGANLTENAARITSLEGVDSLFLFYFLSSSFGQQEIRSRIVGSAQGKLPLYQIKSISVPIPPLSEQKAIADILSALDDKIELNRRMNETLEEMARAIFKSWFVDFDPVRAKVDGRQPTGMDAETAALFPDSFEHIDGELVPKGWKVMPLYETAKFVNGAAFKSIHFCDRSEGLPVIKIAELKNGITKQTKYSNRELEPERTIETGDLLYSWSGSPDTSLDAFIWTKGPGLLNQHIFKVVTDTEAQKQFVYYMLRYLRPTLIEVARNKQTTGLGHVTVSDMKRLWVCGPSSEILSAFENQVGPVYELWFLNSLEADVLAATRDTLLPKLLSGEIRVADAEKVVEEVV